MPVSLNWKPQSGHFWVSALYLHIYTEDSIAFQMFVLFCLVFVIFNFFGCIAPKNMSSSTRPPGSTCWEASSGRPVEGQPFSHFYAQGRDFVVSCWIRAVEFFFYSEEQSVPISLIKKFLCVCKIPGRNPTQRFFWEARYRKSSQWISQPWTDRVNRGEENFTSRPWCHSIKHIFPVSKKWHFSINYEMS